MPIPVIWLRSAVTKCNHSLMPQSFLNFDQKRENYGLMSQQLSFSDVENLTTSDARGSEKQRGRGKKDEIFVHEIWSRRLKRGDGRRMVREKWERRRWKDRLKVSFEAERHCIGYQWRLEACMKIDFLNNLAREEGKLDRRVRAGEAAENAWVVPLNSLSPAGEITTARREEERERKKVSRKITL